jgi:hypothetical protein
VPIFCELFTIKQLTFTLENQPENKARLIPRPDAAVLVVCVTHTNAPNRPPEEHRLTFNLSGSWRKKRKGMQHNTSHEQTRCKLTSSCDRLHHRGGMLYARRVNGAVSASPQPHQRDLSFPACPHAHPFAEQKQLCGCFWKPHAQCAQRGHARRIS